MNAKKVKSPSILNVPDGGHKPSDNSKKLGIPDGGHIPSCKNDRLSIPTNVEN